MSERVSEKGKQWSNPGPSASSHCESIDIPLNAQYSNKYPSTNPPVSLWNKINIESSRWWLQKRNWLFFVNIKFNQSTKICCVHFLMTFLILQALFVKLSSSFMTQSAYQKFCWSVAAKSFETLSNDGALAGKVLCRLSQGWFLWNRHRFHFGEFYFHVLPYS